MSFVAVAIGGSAVLGLGGAALSAKAAGNAAEKQSDAAKYAADLQNQQYEQQRADQSPWRDAGLQALYGGLYTRKDGGQGMAMGQNPEYAKIQAQIDGLKNDPRRVSDHDFFNQTDAQIKDLEAKRDGLGQTIDASKYQIDPNLTRNFTMADFQKDPGYDFRMQEGEKAIQRSAAARGGLQTGGTLRAITDYGQNFASNEYGKAYDRFTNDQTNRFNRLSSLAGLGQTANAAMGQAGQNYANQSGNIAMEGANAQGAAGIAQANAYGNTLSGLGKTWADYSVMSKFAPNNGGYAGNGPMSGITSATGASDLSPRDYSGLV
jgi:hypothetical protein